MLSAPIQECLVIPYIPIHAQDIALVCGRKTRGFGEGTIAFPGGKCGVDTPQTAAARELREETGIDIEAGALHRFGRLTIGFEGFSSEKDTSAKTVSVFAARVPSDLKSHMTAPIADADLDSVHVRCIDDIDLREMAVDYSGWLAVALSQVEQLAATGSCDIEFLSRLQRSPNRTEQQTLIFKNDVLAASTPQAVYLASA